MSNTTTKKHSSTPITDRDRRLLEELAERLGSWAEVSKALGFRGVSTARRWVYTPGSTFKGRDYPQRIRQLHEKVFGVGDATSRLSLVEQKLDEMSDVLSRIAESVS